MQTSADGLNGQRHVSRMNDEKGETWTPFRMSKVRSRPEFLVADCSMPRKVQSPRVARQVDGTCSVVVSVFPKNSSLGFIVSSPACRKFPITMIMKFGERNNGYVKCLLCRKEEFL